MADLGADLAAVLEELDAGRVHLVGSSIGGMAALWVAAHAPERVDRLAVVGTSARLGPSEAWLERASAVLAGGMDAVKESVVGRWVTPTFADAHPQAIAGWQRMVAKNDPAGYAGCCLAIAGMDQTGTLGDIRAPTLVIVGDADPATPVEHARQIADSVADARLEVVTGAAHLPNLEHPDQFSNLLLEHFS
jgi:3-oxoadipate enol-lactonase